MPFLHRYLGSPIINLILRVFFKVPRVTRFTPLARVFDFIATGVPGPRDMLVVGKIAFEERRREPNGTPVWDLIVVDCAASGHVVSHLAAPKAMLTLVRGGLIRNQVQWVEAMVTDSARSTVLICALPQEMPVVEAIELHDRLQSEAGVSVTALVLNRAFAFKSTPTQRALLESMASDAHRAAVSGRLGGSPQPLLDSVELADRLGEATARYERALRDAVRAPTVVIPLEPVRAGLAITRAVADDLATAEL